MKLSIVSTLYHSAPHVDEFYQRASAVAKRFASDDYEIVLVNDGSTDDSLVRAVNISNSDKHAVVVDLSRNFGHHKAMMTGLKYASGDLVFLIDSDLEEEPEWLIPFYDQMKHENCDVVYGAQAQRKGNIFERYSGQLFYRLFRFLSGLHLPDNITVARIMTRRYVRALLLHGEYEVFMAGLWIITGFDQKAHIVKKHSTSKTTYSLQKKVSQFVDSIASFSNTPLVGIFTIGCVIFVISGVYTTFLIAKWLFWSRPPTGYTSLIASVWLLGGMIIAFVGVVGIYLSKIYSETKRRPYTIVRRVYGGPSKEPEHV
jgi:putative glycosyltransferase